MSFKNLNTDISVIKMYFHLKLTGYLCARIKYFPIFGNILAHKFKIKYLGEVKIYCWVLILN